MIGPRCESGTSEQGCETRRARETRETSERGRASGTKRGAARAAHVLTLHCTKVRFARGFPPRAPRLSNNSVCRGGIKVTGSQHVS